MPALRDPRLEKFVVEFAARWLKGVRSGQAAAEAAEAAGYPKTSAKSFAPNARKRLQRDDVQARLAELIKPKTDEAEQQIEATREWAEAKLVNIINYDLGEDAVKVEHQLKSVELLAKFRGWLAPEKFEGTMRPASTLSDDELANIARGGGNRAASAPVDS